MLSGITNAPTEVGNLLISSETVSNACFFPILSSCVDATTQTMPSSFSSLSMHFIGVSVVHISSLMTSVPIEVYQLALSWLPQKPTALQPQ